MFEILNRTNDEIIGLRLSGTLSAPDVESIGAFLKKRVLEHGDIRLLIRLDGWKGWESFTAMWEDLKTEIELNKHVERVAMVGEEDWERWISRISEPFADGEVSYFHANHADEAWNWLQAEVQA